MTTYTSISATAQCTITVDAKQKLNKINPNIYSGFTEHIGRCIYGGLYDPDSPQADEDGFRRDVLDMIRDELRVPVIRYPGGNFTATYHWRDGVGPRENRPARPELAWRGVESNTFGTDEFMAWCKKAKVEPFLCLNFGTGTLEEALAWVEYCNGTANTEYANLRRCNGHAEPYNVKYWALGNEVWGPWQVAQMTKEEYAEKAFQWAKALKMFDPNIQLVLCGCEGFRDWDAYVLRRCLQHNAHPLGKDAENKPLIDMHSIHLYTYSKNPIANALAPLAAERAIQITASLIDLARIENKVPATVPRPTICFDEWNVWSPELAPGEDGAEQIFTLSDALAVAVWLNVFIRQSKHVSMACLAQNVNVIAPVTTTKDGLWYQATYWPLYLYSRYMHGTLLACHVACSEYEGNMEPAWLKGMAQTPYLDVCAVLDEDNGKVNLAVANVSDTLDFAVTLRGLKGSIDVFRVTGPGMDAANSKMTQKVELTTHSISADESNRKEFTFERHSVYLLRWNV